MSTGPIDASLRARAKQVIPNGMYGHESTRLLPATYPQFFGRGDGAYLWDVDGNRYLDFMRELGAVTSELGIQTIVASARPEILTHVPANQQLSVTGSGYLW